MTEKDNSMNRPRCVTVKSSLILAMFALLFAPIAAHADSTHIATGPVSNWLYGWKSSPTGGFTPFQSRSIGYGIPIWSDGSYPYVGFNNTNSTVTVPNKTFRVPKNQILLHPSNDGRLAVVRWTADSEGTYQIQGLFKGLEECGYRRVYIIVNSTMVFSLAINGTAMNTFSSQQALAAGSTVDFEVDDGGNQYYCDGVGVSALITAL